MNRKQRLWIISELFPPEETSTAYIMGIIANAMVDKYDVRAICGPEFYDEKKVAVSCEVSINNQIKIYRAKAVEENKNSKLSRIRKFLLMSWRLYKIAKNKIQINDKVLIVSNPFPLIVLMGHYRRRHHVELKMIVHDIFPDGLYTEMFMPSFAYKVLEKMFSKAYASTDMLISLGRDMTDVLTKKVSKYPNPPEIRIIENWGDVEGIHPIDSSSSNVIRIQYAGNIGRAQGVSEFVDMLCSSGNQQILFSLWGTGSEEDNIKSKVFEKNLQHQVTFNGPYSRNQQTVIFNDSDLSLVTLVKGMYGLGVPSKSYNIMAAGKPILYIGEKGTEIWQTIEENCIGFCFEPDNRVGLVAFLRELNLESLPELKIMGRRARSLAEEKYSMKSILDKFIEAI